MTTAEFNKCVDEFSNNIYRFILKNIKDTDKAKDIVQDTFEKLWMRVDEVGYEKAKSYLFTSAYHTMIDYIRKDKKLTSFDDVDVHSHLYSPEYKGLKEVLNEALNKLPEIQKSVVLLRDYEGYSYKEIGEITDLSEAQVKVYIYRARVFLKDYIGSLDLVL